MDICEESDGGESYGNAAFLASSSRKRRHFDSSTNDSTSSAIANPLALSLETLKRAESPNFEELARQYPRFRAAWVATKSAQKNRGNAAFSSCVTQDFSIELTRAILQASFRLRLPYLDENHLCPPVPNRFFYLHWIQTKLMGVSWVGVSKNNIGNTRGLDIGSGASCIYSMLAARFFRSSMITSEIDPKSTKLARANVAANHLSSMIEVMQVKPSRSQQYGSAIGGPLQRAVEGWFYSQHEQNEYPNNIRSSHSLELDFVMTNPPFYDPSLMEISAARVGDGRSRTNMTVSEGNYPGGEVGFVTEMIEDSLRLNANGRPVSFKNGWYSSMLSKKKSLVKLHKLLVRLLGPAHVETTEYGPGHYTRWFLAWTLEQPTATASGALSSPSDNDRFRVTVVAPLPTQFAVREVVDRIVLFCESSPGGWDLVAMFLDGTATANMYNVMVSRYDGSQPEVIVVRIIEKRMPYPVINFVDEDQTGVEIPESILRILRNRYNEHFLPKEGHFCVEAEIRPAAINAGNNDPSTSMVDVRLSCYRHSARGAKAIEKIRNSLRGEVCRTNRKWRKVHKRQNDRKNLFA